MALVEWRPGCCDPSSRTTHALELNLSMLDTLVMSIEQRTPLCIAACHATPGCAYITIMRHGSCHWHSACNLDWLFTGGSCESARSAAVVQQAPGSQPQVQMVRMRRSGADLLPGRAALAVFVCNSSGQASYSGVAPHDMLVEASELQVSLERLQSSVPRLLVHWGYSPDSLHAEWWRHRGWKLLNMSHVPASIFALQPLREHVPGYLWPRNGFVQYYRRHADAMGTSLKLTAWNLSTWDRLLVVDADTCLAEDPLPWMVKHWTRPFVATPEYAGRKRLGLNTAMMWLQPSERLFDILAAKATTRSFMPYALLLMHETHHRAHTATLLIAPCPTQIYKHRAGRHRGRFRAPRLVPRAPCSHPLPWTTATLRRAVHRV